MKLTTQDLTKAGLFTALHIAAAVVLRFGGEAAVPFSLVPFFVILAGTLLGPKGTWSLVLYALLGLLGLPVFAQAPFGGISYLLRPSAGFVFGYIFAAWAIGWGVSKLPQLTSARVFLVSVVGLAVLYACGLPYLYLVFRFVMGKTLTLQQVLAFGFYPFIAFDLIKAFAASVLTVAIRKRLA
mgnify:CR=1 FL=1